MSLAEFASLPLGFFIGAVLGWVWAGGKDRSLNGKLFAAVYGGSLVMAFCEVLILYPVVKRGTDGPGGLVIIILPLMTIGMGAIGGVVVGALGSLIRSRLDTIDSLSPEAQAILRQSVRQLSPHRPLTEAQKKDWRAYARD